MIAGSVFRMVNATSDSIKYEKVSGDLLPDAITIELNEKNGDKIHIYNLPCQLKKLREGLYAFQFTGKKMILSSGLVWKLIEVYENNSNPGSNR